ncbi:MAG: sialidase family protein [Candidatus Dormibacteria bacterium]
MKRAALAGLLVLSASAGAHGASASTFSFFPDTELPCDVALDGGPTPCGQMLEPEIHTAPDGTIFASAQDGTPNGVHLWRRDPGSFTYTDLSRPDGLPVTGPVQGMDGGGGDNDMAFSLPDPALGGGYRVYVASLNPLLTIEVSVSTDRGQTWSLNPVASTYVGVDRPWIAASRLDPKSLFLSYHTLSHDLLLVKSTDGGATWGAPVEMLSAANLAEAQILNWQGNLVALPGGGVATAFVDPPSGTVASQAAGGPMTELWIATADESTGNVQNHFVGHLDGQASGLFPALSADTAGNLYYATTNQHGIFLTTSADGGTTWSALNQVTANAPAAAKATAVFPFVVAGSPGRAALAWLATSSTDGLNDAAAQWTTQFAFTADALDPAPTFNVTQASDHVVHTGVVCLKGTFCNPTDNSRNLAEVLQMGITPDGRALISYPDDHDHGHLAGWSWVGEQDAGDGLYANISPNPPVLPPPGGGGRALNNFTPTGAMPLYFVNAGPGIAASDGVVDQPGYRFDGTDITGTTQGSAGDNGHFGIIGYAANDLPSTSLANPGAPYNPVVFTTQPMAADTIIGGGASFSLWVQNEATSLGSTELDYTLADVDPTGAARNIDVVSVGTGAAVTGGSQPALNTATHTFTEAGWLIPSGDHLQLSMAFPYSNSSTSRLYYGDPTYASGMVLTVGTGS